MAKDDTTEIVDSISLPEKDPFPGIKHSKSKISTHAFLSSRSLSDGVVRQV